MPSDARDIGPSDRELVDRARDGDAAAFGIVLQRYQDRVFNTIYRMCRNRADAADLTQTTFVKALEALPGYQAQAAVYTWLFRIAVNLTISWLRSRKRVPVSLDSAGRDGRTIEPRPRELQPIGHELEQRELLERLEKALDQLEEDSRVVVVLRDIEGMDYAQISETLGLPVGTVKSRIHRARQILRELVLQESSRRDATQTNLR